MNLPHPYDIFVEKGSQLELDLLFEDSEDLDALFESDFRDLSEIKWKEYKREICRYQLNHW